MAWIKVEYETPFKPEMFDVSSRIGCDICVTFYHWFLLWSWADANLGEDGVANGMTLKDLSTIARLDGLAEAFAEVGWLTEGDRCVVFKDFGKHCGAASRKRALASRRKARQRGTNRDKESRKCRDTQPKVVEKAPDKGGDSGGYKRKFLEFWESYPKKVGKKAAYAKWESALRSGADPDRIIKMVRLYAQSRLGCEYPANPATWLNQGRWDDDPSAWDVSYNGDKGRVLTIRERALAAIERRKASE